MLNNATEKIKRTQVWKFLLPLLRPLSVVSLAVFGLPGNGVQLTPGLPLGQVHLALFLLGKLLVGNEFLHADFLLVWFLKSVYHNRARMHKRFVNYLFCDIIGPKDGDSHESV